MTVDEELTKLEDDLRHLKIEYEVYLNGSSSRPPRDTVFRIEKLIKRYMAGQAELSFSQRYKFNSLAQKYAVQSQLWKRKLMEKEEGRGLFAQQERELEALMTEKTVRVICSDPEREPEKVDRLCKAMIDAKCEVGEKAESIDPVAFRKYIRDKTKQIKVSLGCDKVQFSISIEEGKVKFRAVKA